MTREEFRRLAIKLLPRLPVELIEEFSAGMDPRWFTTYPEELWVAHLQCAARLSPDTPVTVHVENGEETGVSVLAYDMPGLFSLVTGILASMDYQVSSADAFILKAPAAEGNRAPSAKDRVVDVFHGRIDSRLLPSEWMNQLDSRLKETIRLYASGNEEGRRRARARVHAWVVEVLSREKGSVSGYLAPMDLELMNDRDDVNRMRVLAEDTPLFLYTLSGALNLVKVNLERTTIRTREGRIEDIFEFTDTDGRKIMDADRLDRVRMVVLLTKQFTYFLDESPDPLAALERFERMVTDLVEGGSAEKWLDLLGNPLVLRDLAALLGASDYLWEDFIRLQYESLLPMLKSHIGGRSFSKKDADLEKTLKADLERFENWEDGKAALNAFKDREIFRMDLDHILVDSFDFRKLSLRLSRLAQTVIRAALDLTEKKLRKRYGRPRSVAGLETPWAAFGLGKLGGSALGYASDIELLFIYADAGHTDGEQGTTNAEYFERMLRDAVNLIETKKEGIFQLDLRLRPHGASGILASSLEVFCSYYAPDGEAVSLERLALVRLRAIAGDVELGARVERIRDELIYSNPGILDRNELASLRKKQLEEQTRKGHNNAKFSVGGLADLEYTVQILQIEHGGRHPQLRSPSIHAALNELGRLGALEREEAEQLSTAYDFLRNLINALRMLRGSAKDVNLPEYDTLEFTHLARRMGYKTEGSLPPEQKLRLEFETRSAQIRVFVEAALGRESLPDSGGGNLADLILSGNTERKEPLLERLGFQNSHRAVTNMMSLAGNGRRRRRFASLAILASDMSYRSADPDMALNNWERFASGLDDVEDHFDELLAQPTRLEVLLGLFAGSQFLADTLIQNPDLLDEATDPERLRSPRPRENHVEELAVLDGRSGDDEAWRDALRRYRKKEILRIGTRDLVLGDPLELVTAELTSLAEGIVEAALRRVFRMGRLPMQGFSIVALGKLGGRELNYSSDIDILGLVEHAKRLQACTAAMETLRADLAQATVAGAGYRVDLRLRPWGGSGELIQTVESLHRYYETQAAAWEIQALLKLRPIAGDPAPGRDLIKRLHPLLTAGGPPKDVAQSIEKSRRLALNSKTSILHGKNRNIKDGRGGIRDIEFLIQGLQLIHLGRHGALLEGNSLRVLELLETTKILGAGVRKELESDYRFLRKVEHLLQLFEDRQVHHLPGDHERLAPLARRVLHENAAPEDLAGAVEQSMKRVFGHYHRLLLEPAGLEDESGRTSPGT